jgi:hypothetical protein
MPAKTTPLPNNPPAPDPSDSYERSHPEHEVGQGRLDSDEPVPPHCPDVMEQTVGNRQDGSRQINAHETENQRKHIKPAPGQD